MSDTDTSAEVVERLADRHDDHARNYDADNPRAETHRETAATLRALLAERERLATSCGHCGELERAFARAERAEAERDRLRRRCMRVLQEENSCEPTGTPCKSKRCGCLAEMELLIGEAGHD